MKSIALLIAAAAILAAQPIPGRYIVVLKSDPAAAVSIHKKVHYSASDRDVTARKARIQTEHAALAASIQTAGGAVTHHFDTLLNGVGATMSENAAVQLRRDATVKGVYPVMRHHILMDQAAVVHRFNQAYQSLPGGASSAGAGVMIGILDCGVDVNHPAFQNFGPSAPSGFPIFSGTAIASNVNNKVIVARVYSDIDNPNGLVDNTGTDGLDYCDHGTTVAGIAAGLSTPPNFNGVGAIQGVAPGAWIGNYKVLDDYGQGDDITFQMGLEDAFNDGMKVVNYSAGYVMYDYQDEDGADAQAIATALAGGMVYVGAIGNSGPGVGSVGAPAGSPAAIGVGAIENQRFFWFSANLGSLGVFYAIPAAEEIGYVNGDTIGPLTDVSTLTSDTGGYGCGTFPSASLTNQVALIQRGGPNGAACSFATKINNGQMAGAVGAIIYDNTSETLFDYSLSGTDYVDFELGLSDPPTDANGNPLIFDWSMGLATLPSILVGQADGQSIKQLVAANPGAPVDLDFDGKTAMPYPSNTVTDFSSIGPTPLGNVKPDIVAVGDNLVAPVTTQMETPGCPTPYALDLINGCYPVYSFLDSPFLLDFIYGFGYGGYWDDGSGTSFATPMVTGSVAVLMAQTPGLSAAEYRSLVVNSASELDLYPNSLMAAPQTAGAGRLDLVNTLQAALAASTTSLNFASATSGTGGGPTSSALPAAASKPAVRPRAGGNATEAVTITNISGITDTFTATVQSIDGVAVPTLDNSSFSVAPGASQVVNVTIAGAAQLAAGQYHGFLLVAGTQGETTLRIPYWFGVLGSTAQNLLVLYNPQVDPSGCTDAITFRTLDAVGLPFEPTSNPVVTTSNARAQVTGVLPVGDINGTFEAQIVTGRPDVNEENEFTITVGNTTFPPVVVEIDNSGDAPCQSSASVLGTSSVRPVSLLKSREKGPRGGRASRRFSRPTGPGLRSGRMVREWQIRRLGSSSTAIRRRQRHWLSARTNPPSSWTCAPASNPLTSH